MPVATRSRAPKPDAILVDAVDLARSVAVDVAAELAVAGGGVGEHLGISVEDDRVVSHTFACLHPAYRGWEWQVVLARASRAKAVTVNEVVLVPGDAAVLPPTWLPWAERIQAGDVTAGLLLPAPTSDPRLEPGFTGGDAAADPEPAEVTQARAVVAELGLGRERVLSREGRDEAVERWLASDGGPDNQMTKLAPGVCETCGFFVRLQGGLGVSFGVCANAYSASDSRVVSVDHGCGAHSAVPAEDRVEELPQHVWETIEWDVPVSPFD